MRGRSLSPRGQLRLLRRGPGPSGRPGRRWRAALWGGLLGVCLWGAGLIYLGDGPANSVETAALTIGTVEAGVEGEALVVHQEQLYRAPASGKVRRLAEEGQRVRVGAPVAELAPDSGGPPVELRADRSGILAYQVDGLERELDPARAGDWTAAWFRGLSAPSPRRTADGAVVAGEPVFKVVDNVDQGLLMLMEAPALPSLQPGAELLVRLTDRGGRSVPVRLSRLLREFDGALLYLNAPLLPEDLGGVRRVRISLVFAQHTGKVVPRTAIDVRGGRQGVWVLEGWELVFSRVKVLGGGAAEVVVESDLQPGSRIARVAPLHMD